MKKVLKLVLRLLKLISFGFENRIKFVKSKTDKLRRIFINQRLRAMANENVPIYIIMFHFSFYKV